MQEPPSQKDGESRLGFLQQNCNAGVPVLDGKGEQACRGHRPAQGNKEERAPVSRGERQDFAPGARQKREHHKRQDQVLESDDGNRRQITRQGTPEERICSPENGAQDNEQYRVFPQDSLTARAQIVAQLARAFSATVSIGTSLARGRGRGAETVDLNLLIPLPLDPLAL